MSCSICLEDFIDNNKSTSGLAPEEKIAFQLIVNSAFRNQSNTTGCWGRWLFFQCQGSQSRFDENEVKKNPVVTTKCGHVYHLECIIAWTLKRKPSKCPTCRKSVKLKDLTKLHLDMNNPIIKSETDDGKVLVTCTMDHYKTLSSKADEAAANINKLGAQLKTLRLEHDEKIKKMQEKREIEIRQVRSKSKAAMDMKVSEYEEKIKKMKERETEIQMRSNSKTKGTAEMKDSPPRKINKPQNQTSKNNQKTNTAILKPILKSSVRSYS